VSVNAARKPWLSIMLAAAIALFIDRTEGPAMKTSSLEKRKVTDDPNH
jgi:hypothetical protein